MISQEYTAAAALAYGKQANVRNLKATNAVENDKCSQDRRPSDQPKYENIQETRKQCLEEFRKRNATLIHTCNNETQRQQRKLIETRKN